MKIKESIFSWLNHRYQIIIRDDENFAEKPPIAYSHGKLMTIVVPILIVTFAVGFILAYFLSRRSVYAGTGNEAEMRRKVILLSTTVDSLSISLQASEQFVADFRKVMKADNADLRGDTTRMKNTVTKAKQDSTFTEKISPEDKKLRKEYEGTISMGKTAGNNNNNNEVNISLKDFYLFAPIKGLITEKYDAKSKHYGVDIVCRKDEAVKNVADGTVIMASWTEDTGNVIALQHKSNLISIYKHNSVLLKKVGDFVRTGEAVAIVGDTGRLTSGLHLHFELWYNENPVNPEKFITF